MSSVTTSSSNFSSILDAALDSYAKQTGIDLTKHPSADKLQNCRCPDDVLQILSERESASQDHRDHYQTLIDRVRPVVQVVHAFSDVLGEAAGFVSSGIAFSLSDPIFTLPNRFHFSQQKRYLSELIFSFRYIYSLLKFCFSSDSYAIPFYDRPQLVSAQAIMRLLTSLNASRISSGACKSIPRNFHCPLRCPIS